MSTSAVKSYTWIIIGALIGGVAGAIGARRVKMTAMPQMVALFNGLGGGAAALVAFSDYHDAIGGPGDIPAKIIISILFSAVVGALSFSGSMIAFGKLQEMHQRQPPKTVPGQKLITGALFGAIADPRRLPRHRPREPGRCWSWRWCSP